MTTNRKEGLMATNTENEKKPPRYFSDILASIRPSADAELGEELADLIEKVKATGKGGTLTYKLSIKPAGSSGRTVEVADDINAKPPQMPRATSIAFVGEGNTLHRNDPTTAPLFTDEDVRDTGANVDYRTGEVKEV